MPPPRRPHKIGHHLAETNRIYGQRLRAAERHSSELMPALNGQFAQVIPLHHADLSGYGLTSFSEWRLEGDAGFTKVQFEVVNGRTAYEVLQFRSALYECGARLVRTVVLERRNSGRVHRTDSGWVAIESGVFNRPTAFVKGCVKAFHNIRRIRITGAAFVIDPGVAVQPVVFDADAEIEGLPGAEFTRPSAVRHNVRSRTGRSQRHRVRRGCCWQSRVAESWTVDDCPDRSIDVRSSAGRSAARCSHHAEQCRFVSVPRPVGCAPHDASVP